MIKIDKTYFTLNDEPLYIYSGEMHYFRIKPELWKEHLEKAKEAGLNTVSTYIPWMWHEYEEGKFDFSGETHPQRNLKGFLEAVKDSGLYLSVRLGPFSNAELNGEGIPLWLTDNYPEVYSKGEGIMNLPHTTLISYINGTFRKFVKKWYDQLIPCVEPYMASNGGNILLTQLCNEIGMIQWVNNRGDFSKQATQMYQEYLKNKYKDIKNLKELYPESKFKSFDEIEQTCARENYGWQDFWDWADSYRQYFADYYGYLYELAKERGITTPVIANIPQFIDFDVRGRGLASPMTSSFYRYMPDKASNVIFGGAYQMRRLDYENFHDVFITTNVVKTLTDYKNPVVCAELQTGIMRDKPRLYASDVELNLKSSLAAGVDGVNCYMFSKRHKWQAPVSGECETDDKFESLVDHGKLISTFGSKLASTKPVFQTTFGMYVPYYGTEFLSAEQCGFLIYTRDRYFFDGIGRLLNLGSTNFNMVDLLKGDLDPEKVKSLWIFSLSFMDKDVQEKLLKYVKDGGKLLLFPEIPENDLSGKSCRVLIDELGIKVTEKVFKSPVYYGDNECFVEGGVSIVDVDGDYKTLATIDGKTCAISKDIGKGKFVFLGAPMPHYYDYQIDIIDKIATEELGQVRNVKVSPYDVIGTVRSGDNGSFLFLMNYHDRKHKVDVEVDIPESGIKLSEKNICLCPRTGKVLPINVMMDENTKIVFSSAEILSYARTEDTVNLKVKGCVGEEVNIKLDIDGKQLETSHTMNDEVEDIEIKS
jgi:beta-galactosidase